MLAHLKRRPRDQRKQPGQGKGNSNPFSLSKYLFIKYPLCDNNVLETEGERNSNERHDPCFHGAYILMGGETINK